MNTFKVNLEKSFMILTDKMKMKDIFCYNYNFINVSFSFGYFCLVKSKFILTLFLNSHGGFFSKKTFVILSVFVNYNNLGIHIS